MTSAEYIAFLSEEERRIHMASIRRYFEIGLAAGLVTVGILDLDFPGLCLPPRTRMPERKILLLEYRPETPDLIVDDAGVTATLTFEESSYLTRVPWLAVDGIEGASSSDVRSVTRRGNDLSSEVSRIDKEFVEKLLADFRTIRVYMSYHPEVTGVPDSFLPSGWVCGERVLCLAYGFDMVVPIPDLTCEEKGIRATLSFGGQPYLTFVPYEAVEAIVGDELRLKKPNPVRPKLRGV